jgi:hypothetical protein
LLIADHSLTRLTLRQIAEQVGVGLHAVNSIASGASWTGLLGPVDDIKRGHTSGELQGNAVLTDAKVASIKIQLVLPKSERPTLQEIADMHGCSRSTVGFIKAGKTWRHLDDGKPVIYSKNGRLTETQVIDIKTLLALPDGERPSQYAIAVMFNISRSAIMNIHNDSNWAHVKIGCEF